MESPRLKSTSLNGPVPIGFGAHRLLGNVAGIDRRKRAGEQDRQARLRLAQFEGRLIVPH